MSAPPVSPHAGAVAPAASATDAATSSDIWHPSQYLLFAAARARPAEELLTRLDATLALHGLNPALARPMADFSCDISVPVFALAERFNAANVVGVDGSDCMLAQARLAHTNTEDVQQQQRITFEQLKVQEYE
jgi:trans-aconitate methyltransferase